MLIIIYILLFFSPDNKSIKEIDNKAAPEIGGFLPGALGFPPNIKNNPISN